MERLPDLYHRLRPIPSYECIALCFDFRAREKISSWMTDDSLNESVAVVFRGIERTIWSIPL